MKIIEEREHVVLMNEGQKIFGMFHRPLENPKAPAVLICHGFAGQKMGKYRIYVLIAQQLVAKGIATLRIDFRGSGESEGDFSDMTITGEVNDALKGLEFLRNNPHIDSNRIGLLGNSFGGAIAVLAASKDQKVKSMALLAALFNSQQWQKHWELLGSNKADVAIQKEIARILDGHIPGPAFYREFFKLDLEPALKTLHAVPFLHIHSLNDERVGIEQAQEYARCRADSPCETRYIKLHKSDHDFSFVDERSMIVEEVAQWFAKTL